MQGWFKLKTLLAALTLAALGSPAGAVIDYYKATFDVRVDMTTGQQTAIQPFLEIQNPTTNSGSVTVSISIPFNPLASTTTPVTGVAKHQNSQSCSVSSQSIAAGQGLTINALELIAANCITGTGCQTTNCTRSGGCTGTNCHCIIFYPTQNGRCLYIGPNYSIPDRVTFEIEIDRGSAPELCVVRALSYVVDQSTTAAEILGVTESEVDRDDVQ